MAARPGVELSEYHVDALAAMFVLDPGRFDVVVASNLFGDILTDIGGAVMGSIGIAPSANLNPEGDFPSMFEPVHGSAPDIAGQGTRQPARSGLVGRDDARPPRATPTRPRRSWRAMESVLADTDVRTGDLGGTRDHRRGHRRAARGPARTG